MLNKFLSCLAVKYETVENGGDFAVEREGDTLKIFFEKSDGATDWKNNFNFPAKPYRDMKNLWFAHRGFLKVWKSIEPYIADKINDLTVSKIDIIGYSHGAAVALLCFEYVKFNRPDVEVSGVGFGCPRVVWGVARKSVKKRFEGFVVVRNGKDIVTHVPPAVLGFRHVGEVVKVGKAWGFKDFKEAVKTKGIKKALRDCDHIGAVKDHLPSRYAAALKEYTERATK